MYVIKKTLQFTNLLWLHMFRGRYTVNSFNLDCAVLAGNLTFTLIPYIKEIENAQFHVLIYHGNSRCSVN
ncbi:hypothetical protein A1356_21585 [Methylomonas koyamae]|uniref:Uncharacterized protein n=1 Tax=Methylomonas koyamae TaxID=702114 RepID=A0AA91I780_9GAMM|nr:hypothetical protein AYM39_21685 [Methylomonas sp. DH-1]OAI30326.1 hypothetical protein A1356_21585 [Methylomonas koyamae]